MKNKKSFACPQMKIARFYCFLLVLMIGTGIAVAQTKAGDRQRAVQIVKKMTLDEKISQLHGTSDKSNFRIVIGVKRLNIPDMPLCNGPAGLGPAGKGHEGPATALPAPISLAATWNRAAAYQYGAIAGKESVCFGNVLLEAPDVNITRTPHNGRTFETFGEDPYLSGEIGAANIKGIQKQGVMANVKHYAANNQETDRLKIDEIIDERTLREIYLPAFETCVKEGKVASIMAAYNKVNGNHCTENDLLLNKILKREWNFEGFVTSDFGAVHSTVPCAKNGLDLELPDDLYFGAALKKAVQSGKVSESELDEKLVRRFTQMMKFGLWDKEMKKSGIPKEHALVAKKLGEEGMVLLKNDKGILPLNVQNTHRIALIGPYSGKASTGGGGSSFVNPVFTVTPSEGMKQVLASGTTIIQYDGADVDSAVAIAQKSDAVILMLGDHQTEGRDHSISLGKTQDALATRLLQAVPNTVVVLKTGGPILMPWLENCRALLEAWYPGEEDGAAVAEVLFGKACPGGKLPVTFPRNDMETPLQKEMQYPGKDGQVEYSEGLFVGYRWYDRNEKTPLFPFGYGLSYTNFELSNIRMVKDKEGATIFVRVKNVGKMDGSEVVQAYVGLPQSVEDALWQLKGFSKVALKRGESKEVTLHLNKRAFSYWDTASHEWKVAKGNTKIAVGNSSRNFVWNTYVKW
ncbi:MAG: glycosyl hydrolase [Bacteroidales bacterium]|nr:glycosyl hydrolase [Bacteroidales bacterium]